MLTGFSSRWTVVFLRFVLLSSAFCNINRRPFLNSTEYDSRAERKEPKVTSPLPLLTCNETGCINHAFGSHFAIYRPCCQSFLTSRVVSMLFFHIKPAKVVPSNGTASLGCSSCYAVCAPSLSVFLHKIVAFRTVCDGRFLMCVCVHVRVSIYFECQVKPKCSVRQCCCCVHHLFGFWPREKSSSLPVCRARTADWWIESNDFRETTFNESGGMCNSWKSCCSRAARKVTANW